MYKAFFKPCLVFNFFKIPRLESLTHTYITGPLEGVGLGPWLRQSIVSETNQSRWLGNEGLASG
jgi:hypothetical protein